MNSTSSLSSFSSESSSSSSSIDYIYDVHTQVAASLIFYDPVFTESSITYFASVFVKDTDVRALMRTKPYYVIPGGTFAGYAVPEIPIRLMHGTVFRLVISPRRSRSEEELIFSEWREHMLRSVRAVIRQMRDDYGVNIDPFMTYRMYI